MTKITKNTKIAELVKANPASVDAIASIAKPLEKLKNPILRKIMASRVSIAEAAKMGGAQIEDFKRVLSPLGFEFEEDVIETQADAAITKPNWLLNAAAAQIDNYDVRSIIDQGADPLKEILHRFKEVPAGHILCIINSFVPTPLIHLLKQEKAEDSFVESISPTEHHTYFLKKAKDSEVPTPTKSKEKINMNDEESFAVLKKQFGSQIKEVDVRHLEMPGPMQTILGELEVLPANYALFVNHKRVPVYLLEELADKDFEVHINNLDEGNVKMLIFK
jgi:uncharacterized protein (DUF2249 family)